MKPRISILNPAFVYRSSHETDIRKTFEAFRAAQPKAPVIEHPSVVNMKRPKV